jgi:hypothetical protein
MHNKLLLVTIPSYRQPEQLDRALQGLANQTCKDFSVVIIDDKGILWFVVYNGDVFFLLTCIKSA